MSKEKQIEEMAKHCPCYFGEKCCFDDDLPEKCDRLCQFGTYAGILYNAGYRKQSEVAREIFGEIEEAKERWEAIYSSDHFGFGGGAYGYLETDVDHTIYELKKKYMESRE